MRRNIYNSIFAIAIATIALISCDRAEIFDPTAPDATSKGAAVSEVISASAQVETSEYTPRVATKSLVDRTTTRELKCQFLRIDEDVDEDGTGLYTYTDGKDVLCNIDYERAYLVQARVVASPDNTDWNLRSINFTPRQSYKMRIVADAVTGERDTTQYYHTRMVGWYPRDVDRFPDDRNVYERLDNQPDLYDVLDDGRVRIKLSNLTAEDDVMVTDLKEGQFWHGKNGAHYTHPSNTDSHGNDIYTVPFGYNKENPTYLNYFKFKHYRSAIRLYAIAEQSKQNLAMWGNITGVTLANQATSCKIVLPQVVTKKSNLVVDDDGNIVSSLDATTHFSDEIEWSDRKSVDIITTPMFGDDPNQSAELKKTVDFSNLSLEGAGDKDSRIYLGYALIEPNKDVTIELHTSSGVYTLDIPSTYKVGGTSVNLFDPSQYYTVTLSLQTSGTIAEILELDSDEHFYDLTSLRTLDDTKQIYGYGYSNCYIIDPDSEEVASALTSLRTALGDPTVNYDGYAFCAIKAGNGATGLVDKSWYPSSTDLSPASARLIWESSQGLVSSVELVHNYVRFKVKSPFEEGNAVVGVYDIDGNLLWSWHLWLTDTPKDVELGDYKFMDRNLGATAPMTAVGSPSLESYGLYYQWGRKDPSMGPSRYNYSIYSLITSPYWDYASDEYNAAQVKQKAQITLEDAVKNPMYLYLPTAETQNYYYNWLYKDDRKLWGYDYSNGKTNKTIYDPCPLGYRVPAGELEAAITASTTTSSQGTYGHSYKKNGASSTLYLPFAGFKGDDRGSNSVVLTWNHVGKVGDYQTSKTETETGEYYHHRGRVFISNWNDGSSWYYDRGSDKNKYYNSYRFYDYTNRRTAASVRCVKETASYGAIDATFDLTSAGNYEYLVAGDVLTLAYNVTSSNSIITSLSIDLKYTTADGQHVTTNLLEKSSNLGVSQQGTLKFTVQNQDFLTAVGSGGFTFVLSAENDMKSSVKKEQNIANTSFVASFKSYTLQGNHTMTQNEPHEGETFGISLQALTSQGTSIKAVKIYNGTTLLTTIDGTNNSSITSVSGASDKTITVTSAPDALSFAEGGVFPLRAEFVLGDNSTINFNFNAYVWVEGHNYMGTALSGDSWTANPTSETLFYLLKNDSGYLRSISSIPAPEGSATRTSFQQIWHSDSGEWYYAFKFTLTNYDSAYDYYYSTENDTSGSLTQATVSDGALTIEAPHVTVNSNDYGATVGTAWSNLDKTFYVFAREKSSGQYGLATRIDVTKKYDYADTYTITPTSCLQALAKPDFDQLNPDQSFFFRLSNGSSASKLYSVGIGKYINNNKGTIAYDDTGIDIDIEYTDGKGYRFSYYYDGGTYWDSTTNSNISLTGDYYIYTNTGQLSVSMTQTSTYWKIIPYFYGEGYVNPDPNR